MPYNTSTRLWNGIENHFSNLQISPILQEEPHCVSTTLSMLTGGVSPIVFQQRINTQDPASWSEALKPFGLKLAYCPHDIRKLKYYQKELLNLNDLFTLSYYTSKSFLGFNRILRPPNESGWICGSHILILHKDSIYDPALGLKVPAREHKCWNFYTKRIFRVLPVSHHRGL